MYPRLSVRGVGSYAVEVRAPSIVWRPKRKSGWNPWRKVYFFGVWRYLLWVWPFFFASQLPQPCLSASVPLTFLVKLHPCCRFCRYSWWGIHLELEPPQLSMETQEEKRVKSGKKSVFLKILVVQDICTRYLHQYSLRYLMVLVL